MTSTLMEKIIYWIATFLMFALMSLSVVTYHTQHEVMAGYFEAFGYPTYVVYPLAYLKLTAIIVILINRWRNLRDIAYGAYFLNLIMATVAHLIAGDNPVHAYVGLVAVPMSYILCERVRGRPRHDLFLLKPRAGE